MSRSPVDRRILEQVAENKIRQAVEEGRFDHVEGMGKPIPDLHEPYDENWWVRKWMRRERLRGLPKELREVVEERRKP